MSQINPIYVKITAEHDIDGTIKPTILHSPDGRKFEIDKLLNVKPAGTVGSGIGKKYVCRIYGKQVYLFCDEGRWFMER